MTGEISSRLWRLRTAGACSGRAPVGNENAADDKHKPGNQHRCHRFTKEQAGEQDRHDRIERQINDDARRRQPAQRPGEKRELNGGAERAEKYHGNPAVSTERRPARQDAAGGGEQCQRQQAEDDCQHHDKHGAMLAEHRPAEDGIDRCIQSAEKHQPVAKPVARHFAAIRLRAEHDRDAGKSEGDAEKIAARQLLAAKNRRNDQGLDRDSGNADRAARCRRVLQRRAESPRKESEERRAQQRDGNDVGGRNARLRPDERQHGQKTDHRDRVAIERERDWVDFADGKTRHHDAGAGAQRGAAGRDVRQK